MTAVRSVPEPLAEVLSAKVWATYSLLIGMLDVALVKITVDPSKPLTRVAQYNISAEALEGIQPGIPQFLQQGLLVKCVSPCNSPILPARKPKLEADRRLLFCFA